MLPTVGLVLLILTCTTIFNVVPTKADELKTYIVHLSLPEGQDFSKVHQMEEWYNSFLSQIASRSNEKPKMVFAYRHVITGFAAQMSEDQAELTKNLSGVVFVEPEAVYQLQTTHSPHFLGLRQGSGLWKDSNKGKGMIIGLIDTGISPGHPSFNDNGVPAPPSTWKGKCEVAGCNNKLIAIRNFLKRSRTPLDEDGHGTHTSSTAAGNFVDNANVSGIANGTASGIAPLAHIAMYKACAGGICQLGAILAGMDAAIEDGVHVMSLSLGGSSLPFHKHSLSIASFSAVQKGVFVSFAAGNSGPLSETVSNEAPWILTVGASTIDRRIRTSVLLGNKKILDGVSLYQPKDFNHKLRPLVYPGKDGDKHAAGCMKGSLDHIDVKGKVVLCDMSGIGIVGAGQVVKDAGGAAMIIANDKSSGESTDALPHVIPASYVGYKEGVEIKKYLNSTSSPIATILFRGTVLGTKTDPEVADFSSRGPNFASPGILKPDIIGPGVDILAAWIESVDHQTGTKATFKFESGTSMSCPHLAGAASLLKSAHPDWSPAAIKSAIMTTASQVSRNGHIITDEKGQPVDLFAIGSGHVNPPKANEPGLVYDIQPDDYIPYLCGLGYTPLQVQTIVKKKVNCSKTIPEAQLNYPSFAVTLKKGESKTYTRTVTNVGPANSTYTIGDWSVMQGVSVASSSHSQGLHFTSVGQKLTYQVTFFRHIKAKVKGPYIQGHMTWVSGKYSVRTPYSIKYE
ncbi:hypothetical protein QVD17_40737 [Tagetes erecta]|uniref:Uncharacterized protein n=1 Tax=Tagetes erecta TaxID=13708 RepID=A0AAD8JQD8_TARER|nr:hypothetical protein QVD17_40737 [Tagetes erecta]